LGRSIISKIASATPQVLSGGADKNLASFRMPIVENQTVVLAYVIQGQAVAGATMSAWIRPGSGGPIAETATTRMLAANAHYNFACIKEFTAPAAEFQIFELFFSNSTSNFHLAFGALLALNIG